MTFRLEEKLNINNKQLSEFVNWIKKKYAKQIFPAREIESTQREPFEIPKEYKIGNAMLIFLFNLLGNGTYFDLSKRDWPVVLYKLGIEVSVCGINMAWPFVPDPDVRQLALSVVVGGETLALFCSELLTRIAEHRKG